MEDNDINISPMKVAALQLHEMYVELRHAGFARYEALYLVAKLLVGSPEAGD
jgi:hypothetical protein